MSKIEWSYVKPLKSVNDIEKIEEDEGFKFPEDFKLLVTEANGGRPSLSTFDTKNNKEYVFKSLLSFNKDDIETVHKSLQSLKNDLFIPIANDGFGNYIAYNKDDSKLYFMNHETDKSEFISDSFSNLLGKLY